MNRGLRLILVMFLLALVVSCSGNRPKSVIVTEGNAGLVFDNGRLVEVVSAGYHKANPGSWIEQVNVSAMSISFYNHDASTSDGSDVFLAVSADIMRDRSRIMSVYPTYRTIVERDDDLISWATEWLRSVSNEAVSMSDSSYLVVGSNDGVSARRELSEQIKSELSKALAVGGVIVLDVRVQEMNYNDR